MLTRATVAAPQTTISAILVDDEKLASEELAFQLREFPDIEIIATASNGLEAVKLIEDLEPDLVFLDVQMPGLDGMSVIRKLREKNIPLPYFVMATAYDQYAVEAFRWEALDYLLKPVERNRLELAIERARKGIAEKTKAAPAELPPPKPSLQRTKILIKSSHRNFIVDAQEVVYATIDDGLITIVATGMEGQSNYRTIESRSGYVLARASLLSGQYPPHQGSDPVVQVELPASDGR
jgi:two-component system LytT family response regulator/two-component system response regulator LytT